MDVDFQNLKVFLAICETGNMAKAAEQLNVVVSAVSKRMKQLEDDFGVKLFQRSRYGVSPTPAGVALLQHAREIQFSVSKIANVMKSYAEGSKGHILIYASPSAIAESLFNDLADFISHEENRKINIHVEEALTAEVVNAVKNGIASIGICWDNTDLSNIEHQTYRFDSLAIAVPIAHPLAVLDSVSFENTLDFDHIGLPAKSGVNQMLRKFAAIAGKLISYRATVSNFEAALRVVASGAGLSVIPKELLDTYKMPGIKAVALTNKWARRRFVVCYKNYEELSEESQVLVDYLVRSANPVRR